MAITGVWAAYILRLLGASGVPTVDLPRTLLVCSAIPRRFFWACSKFDGARSARGVCLAQLSDSPAYVRRMQTCQSQSGVSLGLHLGSQMKFSVLPQKQLHMKEYNTINSVWNPNFAKLSLIFIEIQQLEKSQSDETFLCWGCYTMLIWYTFYWVLLMMFFNWTY